MSLDKVLGAYGGVPPHLLPGGFFSWPAPAADLVALAGESADNSQAARIHRAMDMFHDTGRAALIAAQLAEDYPPSTLGWIKKVKWTGPQHVPLDQIDFANMRKWNAWNQPEHCGHFIDKIPKKEAKGKHVKPAIYIQRPGHARARVIDGHHRTLAHLALGKPAWAWVGHVTEATGPWDVLHDKQLRGSHSGGTGTDTATEPGKDGGAQAREKFHQLLESQLAKAQKGWTSSLTQLSPSATLVALTAVSAFARASVPEPPEWDESPLELAIPGRGGWDESARHVRTPEGVKMYHAPIGTLITARMRKAAQDAKGSINETQQYAKEGKGLYRPATNAAGVAAQRAANAAKVGAKHTAAPVEHPAHVSGHKVRAVYTHPKSKAALYDLGGGLHAEGEPGKEPGPVRKSAGLDAKALAEKGWIRAAPGVSGEAEKAKPAAAASRRPRVASAAAKGAEALTGGTASQTAASGAMHSAIAKSGMVDDARLKSLESRVDELSKQLDAANEAARQAHESVRRQSAEAKEHALEAKEGAHESHRVKLAVSLLAITAELTAAALSGGLLAPVALMASFPMLLKIAEPLVDYHISTHVKARHAVAHPAEAARKIHGSLVKAQAQRAEHRYQIKADRAHLRADKARKLLAATLELQADLVALSAGPSSLEARTAAILKAGLVYHGVPAETAEHFAQQAAATGCKNATAGLVKARARENGVKLAAPAAEPVSLAFGRTRSYERVEHGKVEQVSAYDRIHDEMARQWWHGQPRYPVGKVSEKYGVVHDTEHPTQNTIGIVRREGLLWHARHQDGHEATDSGKATKALAIKSLVDYHNEALKRTQRADPAKVRRLETQAGVPELPEVPESSPGAGQQGTLFTSPLDRLLSLAQAGASFPKARAR